MSPRRNDIDRLHDLLDGRLTPAEEAEFARARREDPALEREYRELAAVASLLDQSLDVDPPADLLPSVLRAVRAERAAAAPRRRMPAWAEHLLVGAGACALAAVVAAGRVVGPEMIGGAVVEGARGFGLAKTAVMDLAQWDWTLRLLVTLGRAAGTVLGSSAGPLLGISLAALTVATVFGFVMLHGVRSARSGGLGHAHVLA